MQDKIDKLHWMRSQKKRFKGTSLPVGRDDPRPGNPDQKSFGNCIEDATCDILSTKDDCSHGVCYEG